MDMSSRKLRGEGTRSQAESPGGQSDPWRSQEPVCTNHLLAQKMYSSPCSPRSPMPLSAAGDLPSAQQSHLMKRDVQGSAVGAVPLL